MPNVDDSPTAVPVRGGAAKPPSGAAISGSLSGCISMWCGTLMQIGRGGHGCLQAGAQLRAGVVQRGSAHKAPAAHPSAAKAPRTHNVRRTSMFYPFEECTA
jgi:hypothetical protein